MGRILKTRELVASIALVGTIVAASSPFDNENSNEIVDERTEAFSPLNGTAIFNTDVELSALPPELTVTVTQTANPNALDTAIDLPNLTIVALVDLEQKTRINWFTLAGLLKLEMGARGLDYRQPTPPEIMTVVETVASSAGALIYPSDYRNNQSVAKAINNTVAFYKLSYTGDNVLAEGLKTRDALLRTGRPNISNGKIPNGMSDVYGIRVSSLIAGPLQQTIDAVEAKYGIKLHAWGARGNQVDLRDTNSCGNNDRLSVQDMYYARPKSCNPPTAIPGLSRHESGLAVDFYTLDANGAAASVRGGTAFKALKEFGPKFGLKNLPSEPWHWSIDGN